MESFKSFFENHLNIVIDELISENITLTQNENDKQLYILNIDTKYEETSDQKQITTNIGVKSMEKPILYHINIQDLDLRKDFSTRLKGDVWALFRAPDNEYVTNIYETLKTIFKENALGNFDNPIEVEFIELIQDDKAKKSYRKKKVKVKYNPDQLEAFLNYAVEGAAQFMLGETHARSKDYETRQEHQRNLKHMVETLKFDIIINIKSSSPLNKMFKDKLIAKLKEKSGIQLKKFESPDYALTLQPQNAPPLDTEKIKQKIENQIKQYNKEHNYEHKLNISDFIFKGDLKRVQARVEAIPSEPSKEEIETKKKEFQKVNPVITKAHLNELIEEWKKDQISNKKSLKKNLLKAYDDMQQAGELKMRKVHKSVRPFLIDFLDIDIGRFSDEELTNMMGKRILVIDDIITTRSTMADTIRQLDILEPTQVTGLVIFK